MCALRALSQRPQTPVLFRSLPSLLFRPFDIQVSVLPKPLACSDPSAPQTPGLFRFDPQTPGVSRISILLRLFIPKLAKIFSHRRLRLARPTLKGLWPANRVCSEGLSLNPHQISDLFRSLSPSVLPPRPFVVCSYVLPPHAQFFSDCQTSFLNLLTHLGSWAAEGPSGRDPRPHSPQTHFLGYVLRSSTLWL